MISPIVVYHVVVFCSGIRLPLNPQFVSSQFKWSVVFHCELGDPTQNYFSCIGITDEVLI